MNIVVATLNAKYIHTSLALRYLRAFCAGEFDVQIAEFTIKDPAMAISADLFARKPDVIGFSCYIWNIEETIVVIDMLRKVLPDVKIVLGGPEVSYDTAYWMERLTAVDFIVFGEGEETFRDLLRQIAGERKYHFVFGLAYRKAGQAEPILNPGRPKLDLNAIPSPHRFAEDIPGLRNRVTYFETSRGCPFSCQFCLSSIEVGVRYFDIDRVKADLLYLIDSGAKLIKFVDRTFNIKRDYAMDIFRFLIDNHRGCVFQFEITADIMRPEVLDFLAEHAPPGVFRFEIGVQSTNDEANLAVQRRQNFAKLSRTVTKIKESRNIDQHLDLIAGLPHENYDSFRKTFNDVFALQPEELQLGFLKMLRGTGLRRDADKYGYVYMSRAPYEMLGNDLMPFADIVRIKRVEDVLEKYWNAHRMDRTLAYLTGAVYPSAFDFFQRFGDYWEAQGWSRIGHQLEDLFARLWSFLETDRPDGLDPDVAFALLRIDYYLQHKYKPRKTWWDSRVDKQTWTERLRRAAEQLGMDERELQKQAALDSVPFDYARWQQDGTTDRTGGGSLLTILYAGEDAPPRLVVLPAVEQAQMNELGQK